MNKKELIEKYDLQSKNWELATLDSMKDKLRLMFINGELTYDEWYERSHIINYSNDKGVIIIRYEDGDVSVYAIDDEEYDILSK